MSSWKRSITSVSDWLHHHFLWFLVGAYALASFAPAAGLNIRALSLGHVTGFAGVSSVTVPSMLLAILLLNAGLGFRADRLGKIVRSPGVLIGGLAANLFVPVLFILAMSLTLRFWHNHAEVQSILVGLALIASMPVAGSSTAWAQNANGDMVLSLGLVVLSTCLSPITTPAILRVVGWAASGEYAASFSALASQKTSMFLLAFVMTPSLLGILLRTRCSDSFLARIKPGMKLTNMLIVLVLCYSNAAVALPQTVAEPDWDFLACMLGVVLVMCVLGFGAGWGVARAFRADKAREASLVFGLGMTNNGTGLVIAASALAHLPATVLPVIFFNLVQHIVAAIADRLGRRASVQVESA